MEAKYTRREFLTALGLAAGTSQYPIVNALAAPPAPIVALKEPVYNVLITYPNNNGIKIADELTLKQLRERHAKGKLVPNLPSSLYSPLEKDLGAFVDSLERYPNTMQDFKLKKDLGIMVLEYINQDEERLPGSPDIFSLGYDITFVVRTQFDKDSIKIVDLERWGISQSNRLKDSHKIILGRSGGKDYEEWYHGIGTNDGIHSAWRKGEELSKGKHRGDYRVWRVEWKPKEEAANMGHDFDFTKRRIWKELSNALKGIAISPKSKS